MSARDFSNDTSTAAGLDTDPARLAEAATADLGQVGEEVKHQVGALAEEAKAQLSDAADKAKGLAAEQKDLLATQITGVADALQKVAGELEGKGEASAGYVRFIADGASQVTSAVRDNDVDELLAIAQDFGRKQPVAFLGAAALLGFAASRFVLASASRKTGTTPSTLVRSEPVPGYAGTTGGIDAEL